MCVLSRRTPRSTRDGWRRASLGPPYGPSADAYFIGTLLLRRGTLLRRGHEEGHFHSFYVRGHKL